MPRFAGRRAPLLALALLTASLAAPGVAIAGDAPATPGAAGHRRRPVPAAGQRRLRRPALRPRRCATRPPRRPRPSTGRSASWPARRRRCRASTSTSRASGVGDVFVNGRAATLDPRRRGARRHAAAAAARGPGVLHARAPLHGHADHRRPRQRRDRRVLLDAGRLGHGAAAGPRAPPVPLQRPPARQGALHVHARRARRARRRSPTASSPAATRRTGAGSGTTVSASRWRPSSCRSRSGRFTITERPSQDGVAVRDVTPTRLTAGLTPKLAVVTDQLAWLRERVGRLPVRRVRHAGRRRPARVRARDADAVALRHGLVHRRPRRLGAGHGARARAPVVRRQRRAVGVERRVAQRGPRDLVRVHCTPRSAASWPRRPRAPARASRPSRRS